MNTNLIRVPITDKNGKQTTVLKKAGTSPSSATRIPGPASTGVGKSPCTPLTKPKTLTYEESALCWTRLSPESRPVYAGAAQRMPEFLERDTQAILKSIIDKGNVPEQTIYSVLDSMNIDDTYSRNRALEHNMLLVAEQMFAGGHLTEIDLNTGYTLKNCLLGLDFVAPPAQRGPTQKIATVEELEGIAALSYALLKVNTTNISRVSRKAYDGTNVVTYMLHNNHLAALIQKRPKDVERIIFYINERGARGKRDVVELDRFLDSDEGHSVVGEGWL